MATSQLQLLATELLETGGFFIGGDRGYGVRHGPTGIECMHAVALLHEHALRLGAPPNDVFRMIVAEWLYFETSVGEAAPVAVDLLVRAHTHEHFDVQPRHGGTWTAAAQPHGHWQGLASAAAASALDAAPTRTLRLAACALGVSTVGRKAQLFRRCLAAASALQWFPSA